MGIDRADATSFDTIDRTDNELLLGADERHLDFRGSILVDERWITVSTGVRLKNWRGRLYMLVVWPVHGLVMRSMLHRAQYTLSVISTTKIPDAPAT